MNKLVNKNRKIDFKKNVYIYIIWD